MEWIDFIYNWIARVAMIVATFSVKEVWSRAKVELKYISGDRKLKDIDCYNKHGQQVIVIQNVFQAWFVAKWSLYLTDILIFGTSALTQLIIALKLTITINFGTILFTCFMLWPSSLSTNQYHDKFYETMNKRKTTSLHKRSFGFSII